MAAESASESDESQSADLRSLPGGWVWAELGSIAEITIGNSPPGTAYNSRGRGLPLINGPTEFGPGPLDTPTKRQFTEEYTRICKPGDLLICIRGSTTGRTNIAAFTAAIGRGVASIRGFDLQPYINHYVWSRSAALLAIASGSTFPSISAAQLHALAVPLPPLEEQARIIAELEAAMADIDTGVMRLRKARADLPRLRAAVLRAAMSGELTADYRRLRATSQPSERPVSRRSALNSNYQASLFEVAESRQVVLRSRLPDKWQWCRIDKLCDVRLGQSKAPSNRAGEFATPYLRAANISEDGLQLRDILTMDFPPRQQELYRLKAGDIVIAEASGSAAQVGKPAIWQNELPLCCYQNTIIRLRPVAIEPEFMLAALQNCYFNGIFAELSAGVGINHLGASRLSGIEIPVPPADEQTTIASEVGIQLNAISQSRLTIERTLDHAEQLRRSVWKHAFSGKLVPAADNSSAVETELGAIRLKLTAEATNETAARPKRLRRSKDTTMPIALDKILKDHRDGLTPERLFALAGYGAEQIDRLYLESFKNLQKFEVDFDATSSRQVVVGRNGVGKSNLLEAIAWIFRQLDLEEESTFGYEIEYHCNGHYIKIRSSAAKESDGRKLQFRRSYDVTPAVGPGIIAEERPYKPLKQNDFYKRNRAQGPQSNPNRLGSKPVQDIAIMTEM